MGADVCQAVDAGVPGFLFKGRVLHSDVCTSTFRGHFFELYEVVVDSIQLNLLDVDAVVVDLDGTMVDTLGDFCVALNRMLDDLGPPYSCHLIDRATVAQLVGKGSEILIKSVLGHVSQCQLATHVVANQGLANPLELRFPAALESYQRHYRSVNGQHAVVYPGVEAGLQYLKSRGLRMACLTNKPTVFAQALLKAKGLDSYFEQVFGGDSFERKKPDPLPLLKTCEALDTAPARTLMIGDSSNDALAARAAGCPVLLVTYGYNHGQPVRALDADGFTDSLQTLQQIF